MRLELNRFCWSTDDIIWIIKKGGKYNDDREINLQAGFMFVCTLITLILKHSLMAIVLQILVRKPNKLSIEKEDF
jgi:hypothetical protein